MDYTFIGRLGTTHGLNGHLYIQHQLKGKQVFKKLAFLFIELKKDSFIPYQIEESQNIADQEAIIILDEVNNLEDAKKLVGKNVYIPNDLYQQLQPADIAMNFAGFKLYNAANEQLVGTITAILEYPGQLLAQLLIEDKEVLIPLVESQIQQINIAKKEMALFIPEGLLDVYLNG